MAKMLQVEQKKRRLRSREKLRRIITCSSCVFNHVGVTTCDGAVAGGRLELRPPVESSDLDEKVLTTTPVRDTCSVGIWVES